MELEFEQNKLLLRQPVNVLKKKTRPPISQWIWAFLEGGSKREGERLAPPPPQWLRLWV